jgi:hypothetical protein
MGRIYSTHVEGEKCYKILVGKFERKTLLERLAQMGIV